MAEIRIVLEHVVYERVVVIQGKEGIFFIDKIKAHKQFPFGLAHGPEVTFVDLRLHKLEAALNISSKQFSISSRYLIEDSLIGLYEFLRRGFPDKLPSLVINLQRLIGHPQLQSLIAIGFVFEA